MDKILVLDFGGQYDQLIARRVREQHIYAEIVPFDQIGLDEIVGKNYKGIIFTGGPDSVYKEDAPGFDEGILNLGIPVLGICYGAQLMAFLAKGKVEKATVGEYGKIIFSHEESALFEDVPSQSVCWMSHVDYISEAPEGFTVTAWSEHCPCAAFENRDRKLYGVQFHPEVVHTEYGKTILSSFLLNICKAQVDWKMDDFIESSVSRYREMLPEERVLLALSGGVDSSVAALLLNKAIGHRLVCVFVDHGLLRKGEADHIEKTFKERFDLNLIRVDARDRFLEKLKGVREPEEKRKIIGSEFIRVFEEEAKKLGEISYLAQGTIYPDVIESGKGKSAVIKSHHNVGGLPERMAFRKIIEPLRDLFKDEVREVGRKLGLPEDLVSRQPFPGPGLAVRIIGEITEEKIALLQEADAIFREEIMKAEIEKPQQYFAVLTDMHSVGVMGDERTYGYVLALRSVSTDDFMTAEWSRLPYDLLETVSNRITNEVRGISRVVYDITSKPPGTIEWE
ncbi:MAG: glutamine-hydrolyzing GMP synthase [Erysipelotrichaceae bacterium]|nr:glutamine-hydrolyzing GMP synthase [Erysipelotrichaceae bacterium]